MLSRPKPPFRPSGCTIAAALAALAPAASFAATVTIQPLSEAASKDTKIYASVAASNFSSNLNAVSPDITDFRSLVQFDLAPLALLGADDIASATIRLYGTGLNTNGLSNAASVPVTLSPILADWRENAADAGAAPLATWDAFFGANASLGVGAVAATQSVTGVGFFDWDVTALVKSWKNGTLGNNGVMIQAVGPLGNVGIADVDGNGAGVGPALIVTTVPEPATAAAVALGLVAFLPRRRTFASPQP